MIDQNVSAFLIVVRACEGTLGPSGYRMIFGGKLFDSYADHPRIKVPFGDTYSTAAGAYQFLASTWDDCKAHLGLPDFSPESQDKAAIYLIQRRGALEDVRAGRIRVAISILNKEWASLPGSPYGQPTRTIEFCERTFTEAGGKLRELVPNSGPTVPNLGLHDRPASVPNETRKPMGSLLATLLPTVLSVFAPQARAAISKATGDPVAGAAITQELFSKLGQAVGIPVVDEASAIDAASAVKSLPPGKVKLLEDAFVSHAVVEAGGGIGGAREEYAALMRDFDDDPVWRIAAKFFFNPVHWVTGVFLFYVQQFIPPLAKSVEGLDKAAAMGLIVIVFGVIAVVGVRWLGAYVKESKE